MATRPLKEFENQVKFFTNPTYGIDLNIGAGFNIGGGGSAEVIYEDNVPGEWLTSIIVGGGFDFLSTIEVYSGTYSVDATTSTNNDTFQFDNGSSFDLTNYSAIQGAVYLTSWSIAGIKQVNLYGWDTSLGVIGNTVDIGNYINTGLLNTWQIFTISLSDMGLAGASIDAIRVINIDLGPGGPPEYYLDAVSLEESDLVTSGGGLGVVSYEIVPDKEKWLRVSTLNITMAAAYDSSIINGTMPGLPYDTFLGVPATSGIVYQRWQNGEITTNFVVTKLIDFLSFPGTEIRSMGYDNTTTFFTLELPIVEPTLLKYESNDRISISISDDFSSLDYFRISAGTQEESRPINGYV